MTRIVTTLALLAAWAGLAAMTASPAHAASTPPCVAAGSTDSYLVRPDGTLWSFGGNLYGELGLGDITPRAVPIQVGTDTDWATVATSRGGDHLVMAIKQDHTLWVWGDNEPYYLGLSGVLRLVPTQVGVETDWAAVAVGEEYAIAIKTDGALWAFGSNPYGQLGLGDTSDRLAFTQVGSDTDWKAVACGTAHTIALKQDGTLWAWGLNSNGQLGSGGTTDATTPKQVGSDTDWASIACGHYHTLAVKSGGTLWAWGDNFFGAIGQGDSGNSYSTPVQVGSATDWVAGAGGVWHSIGLKADGTLWGWGDNGYGALGVGLQNHEIGKTFTPTPTQIDAATDWTTVAAGSLHTLAAKNDGSFLAWGDNGYGQIGVGYPLMRSTPTQIGSDPGWTSVAAGNEQAAATRDDGTLWSWRALSRTPAQVGAARDWARVFSGRQYFVGLKGDGTLWSWGSANGSGELGVGDTDLHEDPAQVGTDDQWTTVACGSAVLTDGESAEDATSHTVALKADGSLWTWGSNTDGELGRGSADASPHATPKQVGSDTDWTWIAAGAHCTYAIKQNGSLYAWGKNTDGRLGLGDTTSRSTPTLAGTGWATVAAGADRDHGFALGVKTDHTLWAWGNDDGFELGFPNGQTTPDHLSPTQVGSDTDWLKVATGGEIGAAHTLAIKTDGTLWAWGANGGGALGNGTYLWQLTPVGADADPHWSTVVCSGESYAIKDDGTLWAWGPNWDSQLGLGDPLWHPQPVDLVFTGDADTTAPTVTASPSPSSAPAGGSPANASPRAAGDARLGAAAPGWYAGKTRVSFTASDGGWGVARTQYSLNGGVGWLTADAFMLSGNGRKTIAYQAVDRAGNASPTVSFTVHIDSLRPATAALTAAKVVRNHSCTLSYKATDKWSPTCAVKVLIKRGAHVVKTIPLGQQKSGVSHRTTVRCPWAKGAYRWYVYATDLAGNRQAKVASNSLVVR